MAFIYELKAQNTANIAFFVWPYIPSRLPKWPAATPVPSESEARSSWAQIPAKPRSQGRKTHTPEREG